MSGSHGAMHMSMGGLPMSVSPGATDILPEWLAVTWTLVFASIAVVHVRHLLETHGERRLWHSGHVLMAIGMVFMFAPTSLDHFGIPADFWRLAFANAAGAVVVWILVALSNGTPVNRLWLVMAVDFAAMVYMWSPAGFVPAVTWVLVTYFVLQTLLWATDMYRELDRKPLGEWSFQFAGGAVAARGVSALVCERDLRVSMGAMVLGMAYMLAAMQLLR
jgi:hypothetical protein